MLSLLRRYFPLFLVIGAFVVVVAFYFHLKNIAAKSGPSPLPEITRTPAPVPEAAPETAPSLEIPPPALSPLAEPPDWKILQPFQKSITRSEFEHMLNDVFAIGDAWKTFIKLTDTNAVIQTDTGGIFILNFASPPLPSPAKPWKSCAELPPAPAGKPLYGLHIAIDPGHIGGEWAKMEERWFVLGGGKPVCEGDMTLAVAKLLQPRLEALGAKVSLVRDKTEPVTSIRPENLLTLAEKSATPGQNLQKFAERLFYRTAEIHDRAKLVNETLKPDLVLCLHFNAEGWGDPQNPTLVPHNHFHLLLNGAYATDEIAMADQRFTAVHKILERIHPEEVALGSTIATAFAEITKLPPYQYLPTASAKPVPGQPYLWCRNLLANRLYNCPVIYLEPYVMNSETDYARIQAGDYEGLQEIAGQSRPSIFREYADAVTEGLRRHYSEHRR